MPNPSNEKPKQRPLSAQELEIARGWSSKWTESQLQLIWKRKMPVGATMDDFEMFIYSCQSRGLDPLLGESFCRRQWDSEINDYKLLIMDGIHGMTKVADATGQLDGIEQSVLEKDGEIVSATAIVHKKGCAQPFVATAHFSEYAAYKSEGVLQKIWREKGRVMISKCALALALRLGFASALGGVYLPEEIREDGERDEMRPEYDFSGGVRGKYADTEFVIHEVEPELIPAPEIKPEPPATKENIPDESTMSPEEIKKSQILKNKALSQRVLLDLACPAHLRTALLSNFIRGFLGVEEIPRDPAVVFPALETLDLYCTKAPLAARQEFADAPAALGKRLKEANAKKENSTTEAKEESA